MNRPRSNWERGLGAAGSLRITVLGLALLIVLTLWGTLYQAGHGLYRAQQTFYHSWFFLGWGWLPFPGAQTLMLVLFVNLAASMIHLALLRKLRWGLVLTHGGLLLMLAAGAVTFYYGSESQLTLLEGEGANVADAYQDWELAAWPADQGPADRLVSAVDADALRPGATIRFAELGITVTVEAFHPNCVPGVGDAGDGSLLSSGGWSALAAIDREGEPAQDRPGAILRVAAGGGGAARVLAWGGDDRAVVSPGGDGQIAWRLRRKRVLLPAVIQLIEFTREFHPDSQIPRSFSSRVRIRDGDLEREVRISMNKPLRYKGFTFYQSSYQALPGGKKSSTLAVVRNYGRMMPYVATAVTVVGMLLHFIGLLIARLRGTAPAGEVAA